MTSSRSVLPPDTRFVRVTCGGCGVSIVLPDPVTIYVAITIDTPCGCADPKHLDFSPAPRADYEAQLV